MVLRRISATSVTLGAGVETVALNSSSKAEGSEDAELEWVVETEEEEKEEEEESGKNRGRGREGV